MLRAYRKTGSTLTAIAPGAALDAAIWIDLYRPMPEQVARVQEMGIAVPTLADMEEIEISSRLYLESECAFMTAILPGLTPAGETVSGPVTFILSQERLVTVRHHAPRPFDSFAERPDRSASGTGSADRLFLGLIEEIIARLADILENAGHALDDTARAVFNPESRRRPAMLQAALQRIGQQSETVARVRLGLLSLERVLSFHAATQASRAETSKLKVIIKAHQRDVQALEEHADFLSARVSLATDATLGMINLQQNNTVRVLSVVTALFLPPTLIASTYGMNFEYMPELHWRWGYAWAVGLMLGSAALTWLILWYKKWL